MKSPVGANETIVLETLKAAHRPMSAYAVLEQLHGTRIRAAVQVYRALDKLMQNNLVHRLESLNAFVICDCAHGGSSPGFMLCICCGDVKEFDAGKTVLAVQGQLSNFKVQNPSLELKGLCADCQTENHSHADHA